MSADSTCHYKGHGFDPRSRKIPRAVEQPRPRATTSEAVLQLTKPECLEQPALGNKRSRQDEQPEHQIKLTTAREKPVSNDEYPAQPKTDKVE